MKRIIKVLLSSIFCLSTLVGCSSSPYAKAEAQTLTIQGVPVYVEPDEETTQEDIDTFLKAIKVQPEFLKKNCTGIHLQGENAFINYAQQNFGDKYNKAFGYTIGEDVFWHVFDYANGNDEYYLSEFDFNILYNQNPDSISEYGATNVLEFFAEGGAMYINSPEELKEKNIDVYNYFEALPKE